MRIEKTNNAVNFNSIYSLKGNLKDLVHIKNEVIPLLNTVKPDSKVLAIGVDEMVTAPLRQTIGKIAGQTGLGGADWLTQNIKKNYGININLGKKQDIFVFTGDDTAKLDKYLRGRKSPLQSIANEFSIMKDTFVAWGKNLPAHAGAAHIANNFFKREESAFYKFAAQNCKKADNIQDLIAKVTKDEVK